MSEHERMDLTCLCPLQYTRATVSTGKCAWNIHNTHSQHTFILSSFLSLLEAQSQWDGRWEAGEYSGSGCLISGPKVLGSHPNVRCPQLPLVDVSLSKTLNPNCSWRAGCRLHGWFCRRCVNVCINWCKSLRIKASAKCPKCKCKCRTGGDVAQYDMAGQSKGKMGLGPPGWVMG